MKGSGCQPSRASWCGHCHHGKVGSRLVLTHQRAVNSLQLDSPSRDEAVSDSALDGVYVACNWPRTHPDLELTGQGADLSTVLGGIPMLQSLRRMLGPPLRLKSRLWVARVIAFHHVIARNQGLPRQLIEGCQLMVSTNQGPMTGQAANPTAAHVHPPWVLCPIA